jgi:hypothetical protein
MKGEGGTGEEERSIYEENSLHSPNARFIFGIYGLDAGIC